MPPRQLVPCDDADAEELACVTEIHERSTPVRLDPDPPRHGVTGLRQCRLFGLGLDRQFDQAVDSVNTN